MRLHLMRYLFLFCIVLCLISDVAHVGVFGKAAALVFFLCIVTSASLCHVRVWVFDLETSRERINSLFIYCFFFSFSASMANNKL